MICDLQHINGSFEVTYGENERKYGIVAMESQPGGGGGKSKQHNKKTATTAERI